MTSLGAELPREMARVARAAVDMATRNRGDLALIRLAMIDRAAEATATGDVIACLRAYEGLKALRT